MSEVKRPWVVQKFGGTSVGKFPLKIAKEIVAEYEKDARTVVVCSARSNNVKAQGTTTCLLRATDYAVQRKNFREVIEGIRDDHLVAAEAAITGHPEIRKELEKAITDECANVLRILDASCVLDEVSPRTMDLVLSAGEKLSCLFVVAVLKSIGQNAELVDLTRVLSCSAACTPHATEPIKLDRAFYADLESRMASAVKHTANAQTNASGQRAIPVVTGFFGLLPGGLINNIGRGYTDLCAALCAVGLNAEELQIWKEVDGIFTADPRKVPDARLLDQITPEEAAELTYYGSEVIHPFTMDQVIQAHIPIRIKNVMKPRGAGTKVFPTPQQMMVAAKATTMSAEEKEKLDKLDTHKGPTAITSKGNIIVLNIISNRTRQSHGFLAQVFGVLDRWRLVVDLISTSEVHVSMAIHESSPEMPVTEALREIRQYGTVDVIENLSIVSLVGTKMKQHVGIAAQMFSTLATAGVNIEMISQGSSEINISCVISASQVLKAIRTLHERLLS